MRKHPSIPLFLICALSATGFAHYFIQGHVKNNIGLAVDGASVELEGAAKTQTDSDGAFVFHSITHNISRSRAYNEKAFSMRLAQDRIMLSGIYNKNINISLYAPSGKTVYKKVIAAAQQSKLTFSTSLQNQHASGTYFLKIKIGHSIHILRVLKIGSIIMQPSSQIVSSAPESRLQKKLAARQLIVSKAGYYPVRKSLEHDTMLSIVITLYDSALTIPSAVTVVESTETKSFATPIDYAHSVEKEMLWANASLVKSHNNVGKGYGKLVEKTFGVVHLDNQLIRVTVAPQLGMRIIRVLDKTAMPRRQMFSVDDNPVNESGFLQNIGGVKPSFPFFEHSTGMIDDAGNFDAKAGYYINRRHDGSAQVVMNLRFDYHQTERDVANAGKYGDRTLSSVVTLKPGHSDFEVDYVAHNPNPLRRSAVIWNDALFPQESETDWGGQWILPCRWAIDHNAMKSYDIAANGIKDSWTNSYFGLDMKYPFAGAYYSAADANHLRICDPVSAPGAKIYDGGIKELWGATSVLFELPVGWIDAFETRTLAFKDYMARGLGAAVAYANEHVAIAANGASFTMNAPMAMIVDIYEYNNTSTPLLAGKTIGPKTTISGTFQKGLRVVSAGKELCNVALPLELVDNSARYDEIKAIIDTIRLSKETMNTIDATQGMYYEMSIVPAKGKQLSNLAVIPASGRTSSSDDADILMSMANTAYRIGHFSIAESLMQKVGTGKPSESAYLKGLIALEKAEIADFSNATIDGNYFKALAYIGQKNTAQAIAALDALCAQKPDAVRPRLCRAWLKNDLADALIALSLDPGSVETWTTLRQLGYPGADKNLASLLNQDAMATVAMNAFLDEVSAGSWRHSRRFEYDASWFERATVPAFPASLKYGNPNP